MCTVEMPAVAAHPFPEQLLDTYNKGALTIMISIGHQTGLFDVMSNLPPSGSQEVADAAHLQERYVREWLGAMVAGRIITYNPETRQYHLPAQHAAFLTRAAGADNLSVFAQYMPVLASVEGEIINCFRNGGGVPYQSYKRFHQVMAEDSGQSVLSSLLDHILPLIPGIIPSLEQGIAVLDIGCGSGRALNLMARAFPKSRFWGYDLCEEPILAARLEAQRNGLSNVVFEQRDLTHFRPTQQFDLITAFDAIHDQARPDKVLSLVLNALQPDGVFLMQDIDASSHPQNNLDHPMGTLLYTVSCMHCMSVSLAQNGMGLGAMWGVEKAQAMLTEAGFTDVTIHRLPHDVQNCYYIIRK